MASLLLNTFHVKCCLFAKHQRLHEKETIMKIKYLAGLILYVAALATQGCGKSSDTPASVTTQPTSTTAIAGMAAKGPISGATVQAFAIRNGVTDTIPLGEGQTDVKGNYSVQTFGYKGPVMVEVTGGSYKDEISGKQVTVKIPLRAMFSSAGTGTTTMAVTPLTELAARMADGFGDLTGAVIDDSNRRLASAFSTTSVSITNIVTSLPNTISSDANQVGYAAALGAFSQLLTDSTRAGDIAAGQTLDDALATVITTLGNDLAQTGGFFSTASKASISLAQSLFSAGGTTLPPLLNPPPPGPTAGVIKFGTSGTTTDLVTQISMTVALPPGVTVDVAPGTNIAANISVIPSPLARAETLTAFATQSTSTIPGSLSIQANAPRGIALGQFLIINFNVAGTFPAQADFALTGVSVFGLKTGSLNGIIGVQPIFFSPL